METKNTQTEQSKKKPNMTSFVLKIISIFVICVAIIAIINSAHDHIEGGVLSGIIAIIGAIFTYSFGEIINLLQQLVDKE